MAVSRVIPVRNVSYRVENTVSPATVGKFKSANLMGSRHDKGIHNDANLMGSRHGEGTYSFIDFTSDLIDHCGMLTCYQKNCHLNKNQSDGY